ncbi:hypothetical protein GCM10009727_22800 [Actinomadura napierensis]|uniref:Uncharacterized protein n=1 Tax=Actinomadura napierensis TaxID=267854 RepID=A0ABP5KCY8_9ACTN
MRVAIDRVAAAMVAVAPTLEAKSQVSPSYLVEFMLCPVFPRIGSRGGVICSIRTDQPTVVGHPHPSN